ncbi:Prolyl endopeptidase [hydrothermal vent metagenome]|uniref:prolyl oligopeptidase n=1 Tax=hydrothermal vent metagenome TaxID=652676 RepID=A0A3B1E2S3_9ZZZZ
MSLQNILSRENEHLRLGFFSLSVLFSFGVFALPSSLLAKRPSMTYPQTKKVDQTDNYHGIKVSDPYRWLEEDVRESKEVAKWVDDENKVTSDYLKEIPQREKIHQLIKKLWNHEKLGRPFKAGGRYYFYKNDGLQNQYVLYRQQTLDATPQVLIDPNQWSEDGTVALSGTAFSDDGKYLAYGVQKSGSDWRTWHIMEIETGKILKEELNWLKSRSVSWNHESTGFYYPRYNEPKEGEDFQSLNLNQKLYFHKVGTEQSADELIYHRDDHPKWGFQPYVTEDGRYLIITIWKGTAHKYRLLYKDLKDEKSKPIMLIDHFNDEYNFIGNDEKTFYFKTDLNAPNKRVIAIDIDTPHAKNFREIIPEGKEVMTSVGMLNNWFVVGSLKDATTQIRFYKTDGTFEREVEFPGIGSAFGFGGKRNDTETFYSFSSFTTPSRNYQYNMTTGKSKLLQETKIADFDPDQFEVKQIFYKSKDGTRVPMFLAHKKGLKLDGSNPTLLYAYGGFDISLTPHFSISRLAWMKMGGVYAVANLRGGGEYGENWHQAGMKENKQNVFDDFISAAQWLIENKYTQSKKLAIQGGSNGGLLVGAVMTQRPELFGACLPAVGVMDMLRFHKFTSGRFWVDEYGSSENANEFKALYAYSPYHNLKQGVKYPATLVTTADTDDRVVPGHSFKFAARLQEVQSGNAPVLIRIETKAGHGSGKPASKAIDEIADLWAFLVRSLDMNISE